MFNGFLEVALFVERFRNIDLFQQGLYRLRFRLARGSCLAQPYDHQKTSHADQLYSLIPPMCDPDESCFNTSAFLIRYSEEEAQLRELVLFRYEAPPAEMEEMTLTVELYYSELDRDFTLDTLNDRLEGMSSIKFKCVSSMQVPLRNPRSCILEPLVLEFDEMHRCVVLGVLACVLFDYRFRALDRRANSDQLSQQLAQVLIRDKQGKPKRLAGADETDRLYEEFVRPQALSHELLRSYLCDLINRYIPPGSKAQYSDLPPPLSLPQYQRPGFAAGTKFSQAVASHEAVDICTALLSETAYIAQQIYKLNQRFRDLLGSFPLHCMSPLFEKRLERLRNWSAGSIHRTNHRVTAIPAFQEVDIEDQRKQFAREQRSLNTSLSHRYASPIEFPPGQPHNSPILFEDCYSLRDAAPPPRLPLEERPQRHGKKHLFVLVHGFHGKPLDLRLVKHFISGFSTSVTVLSATANEDNSEGDLFDMGEKLAREVKAYIAEWLPGTSLSRLSFVGYSLGGLVVRAALPHLAEFAAVMHTFLSFSAPHLGHMSDASLVGAGLWVLERVKRAQILQQLLLNDSPDPQRTALYRLSQTEGLQWFQHVAVCSSYQDKYVPRDSARIELSAAMSSQQDKGRAYAEMAHNLLSSLAPDRFCRIDADFCDIGVSLDSVTGRSAHLLFVTSEHFLKLLIYQYSEMFS